MANELAGFNPDLFRSSITSTMIMGLPQNDAEKPTFHFPQTSVWPGGTRLDTEGRPIDPRVKPVSASGKTAVQVPCAVEYATDTTNEGTMVGTFWDARAVVTVLDTDYATIKDAIEVDLSTKRYLIQEMTEVGLGPVTVYQLMCFRKGVDTS